MLQVFYTHNIPFIQREFLIHLNEDEPLADVTDFFKGIKEVSCCRIVRQWLNDPRPVDLKKLLSITPRHN